MVYFIPTELSRSVLDMLFILFVVISFLNDESTAFEPTITRYYVQPRQIFRSKSCIDCASMALHSKMKCTSLTWNKYVKSSSSTTRKNPGNRASSNLFGPAPSSRLHLALPNDGKGLENAEEALKLDGFINPCGLAFLKTIREYGNARMARRAVGVLEKMSAYECPPEELHYTECIIACEKSDQFVQALAVFDEMKAAEVPRTARTYEAMISCAEKVGKWEEAIALLRDMKEEGLVRSTAAFNSAMWAADKGGHWELAIELLKEMEEEDIPRNAVTYSACTWACEKGGEGLTALHVLELMDKEGIEMNTPTYNAAIWSCVKAGGMPREALSLFRQMEEKKRQADRRGDLASASMIQPDMDSYTAAIWACEQTGDWQKAVELLKLAKFENLKRTAMAFDGALSAAEKGLQWELMYDMLKWMERENVGRTFVSYKTTIQALVTAEQNDLAMEVYLNALREGYFSPWIPKSRIIDISNGFTTPIAKVCLKHVLDSMQTKKMVPFTLNIVCVTAEAIAKKEADMECPVPQLFSGAPDEAIEASSYTCDDDLDVDDLISYIGTLEPIGVLDISKSKDIEGNRIIVITRESLLNWAGFGFPY